MTTQPLLQTLLIVFLTAATISMIVRIQLNHLHTKSYIKECTNEHVIFVIINIKFTKKKILEVLKD